MKKVLVPKEDIIFDPTNKTVDITGFIKLIELEQILGIVNVTRGEAIYSPIDINKSGQLTILNSSTVRLNLVYDTTSMSAFDELQVWIYDNFNIGFKENLYSISTKNIPVTISSVTLTPVISIRPSATSTKLISPTQLSFFNKNGSSYVSIILSGQLTGAVWTPHPDTNQVEYDISASTITGGRIILEEYVDKKVQASLRELVNDYSLKYNGIQEILTIAAIDLKSTQVQGYGSISWREI